MQAILADTEFLAQNAIMDYSLLTCIDDSTGELVVGIIGKLVRGRAVCVACKTTSYVVQFLSTFVDCDCAMKSVCNILFELKMSYNFNHELQSVH